MGLKVSDLKPSPNSVYGFTGDSVTPMGVISLPMNLGDYPWKSYVMADFLVIYHSLAFNAVLDISSLRALKAITSIYHLMMKLPIPNYMGQVHGNHNKARKCYNQVVRNASRNWQVNIIKQQPPSEGPLDDTINLRWPDKEATTRPTEDLVDLPVDDEKPSKVLKLGKKLIWWALRSDLDLSKVESGCVRLDALRHGGDRPEIMCHLLNIDPNTKLVRQKWRAMDVEHYQALKDEVDKLFTCDFIKESFYSS